jgi:N-glycosylase/DNA lyase
MTTNVISGRLEYAVEKVCAQVVVNSKKMSWHACDDGVLWHELVSCILGSQVQYEHSKAASAYLASQKLLDIEKLKIGAEKFEQDITKALEQPIFPPMTNKGGRKYRYPKLRANHIRRTAEQIYMSNNSIKDILLSCNSEKIARAKIVSFAVGIGPKQASLFLRNIGYARNLAILDSHILKYMSLVGLLPQLMRSVPTLNKYETIEQILYSYSEKFTTSLAYIDTAIWVVMRTCWKEGILI